MSGKRKKKKQSKTSTPKKATTKKVTPDQASSEGPKRPLVETSSPPKRSFDLQNYVVLFLDVLGQKENLLRFQLVPTDTEEGTRVVLATAGLITELRDMAFRVLDNSDTETEFMKSLPREEQEAVKAVTRSEARLSQTLSDALVISAPFGTSNDDLGIPTNGIRWALLVSCWLQLRALARKHAIRGGIDVGWGVQLDSSEVYGAALASAYQLESRRADYPRVVCGSELKQYLDFATLHRSRAPSSEVAANTAEHCKKFMFRDDDDVVAVDFMGEAFHEGAHRVPGMPDIINEAYVFVTVECDRFTTYGPDKLGKRYRRLQKYMKSRLDLWL